MKHTNISLICSLFFFLMMIIPAFASAQNNRYAMVVKNDSMVVNRIPVENSSTYLREQVVSDTIYLSDRVDNFGGFHLSGELLFGTGRCDDKMCPGHYDDYNEEAWVLTGIFQLEAGYFWGERVFIGPTISVTSGIPIVIGAALNLKMLFPFTDKDAIGASAGIGFGLNVGYEGQYWWVDESFVNTMYLPFRLGYEHVFDSKWFLGLYLQANVGFIVHDPDEPHCGDGLIEPILSSLTGGVSVGYKF